MFEGSKKGLTAKYLINSFFGFNDVALTRGWASSGLRSIFRNKVFGKRASKRLSGQFISRVFFLPWRAKREGLIFHISSFSWGLERMTFRPISMLMCVSSGLASLCWEDFCILMTDYEAVGSIKAANIDLYLTYSNFYVPNTTTRVPF